MKVILIMLLLSIFDFASASIKMTTSADGFVKFKAIGRPQLIRIHGEVTSPKGEIEIVNNQLQGVFELSLTDVKTGIELRDEHLKNDYLEVKQYPKANLTLKPVTIDVALLKTKKQSGTFTGLLTLHGITKEVQGTFTLDPRGETIEVHIQWSLVLSDFDIKIPSYLGVTVSKNVEIETKVTLQ